VANRERRTTPDHADARSALLGTEHVRSQPRAVGRLPHFREIAERLGPIDLALLPIGAYEPRWFMKDIHMNPAEAVQAHLDLAAHQSLAMHFGTFQLTPEGIDDPVRELAKALRERGIAAEQFRTVEVGKSVWLPGDR
jgi:L-ascorbate metabolism protein UlaG (beta-lactamase superfamily)